MTDTPAPLPAAVALAAPPDLPTPTPASSPPSSPEPAPAAAAPSSPPAPAAAPSSPELAGWDPRVHESPPRRNYAGGWAKLRGNAARKAKGLPLIGAVAGMTPRPPAAAPADPASSPPPAAPPAAPPAGPSVLVTDPPTPGAAGAEVEGQPAPPAGPLDLAAYEATAAAVTGGMFGTLSIVLGKAWEPEPRESAAWRAAWARVFHAYQWRPLGPLVEVVLLAVTSTAKRRDDPETRAKVGGLFAWFRRKSGRATVAEAAAAPPPVEPAPPPAAAPDAVIVHPLARGW